MKVKTKVLVLIPLLLTFICASLNSVQAQTIVTFETNLGQIQIELFDDTRPISVANFLGYVNPVSYTHLTLPTNREV